MVFSQLVNGSGAAAYVVSCDQRPRSSATASNFAPVFYAVAPTVNTSDVNNPDTPAGWFAFMSRTVVHETKHIAAQSARFANQASSFEESWLEEGTPCCRGNVGS